VDQLDQVIPEDNLARCRGDVLAQLERGFIGLADIELAAALFDVGTRKAQALQNTLPACFEEGAEGRGI
jgi:DNA modification methylase